MASNVYEGYDTWAKEVSLPSRNATIATQFLQTAPASRKGKLEPLFPKVANDQVNFRLVQPNYIAVGYYYNQGDPAVQEIARHCYISPYVDDCLGQWLFNFILRALGYFNGRDANLSLVAYSTDASTKCNYISGDYGQGPNKRTCPDNSTISTANPFIDSTMGIKAQAKNSPCRRNLTDEQMRELAFLMDQVNAMTYTALAAQVQTSLIDAHQNVMIRARHTLESARTDTCPEEVTGNGCKSTVE
ncbi:hypothetical protein VHEMI09268 [[Torrubiella] hemipterigena]|uniref:Uncharacterized protein n=1 Tax=[Torrubiella] hemipterigena TaxID=1531966 RepID=A0A0A1TPS8_9HYPO|nr:hypothetical protein VHEMI09268 [[Torrubiella] hemipterigena]